MEFVSYQEGRTRRCPKFQGKLDLNQKKNVPIEIVYDLFEFFALRATLFAELVLD